MVLRKKVKVIRQVYIASLICSIIATVGLTYWAFINAPFIYTTGVVAICGANILNHIALIKGEQK
jgi:hypothetical protein